MSHLKIRLTFLLPFFPGLFCCINIFPKIIVFILLFYLVSCFFFFSVSVLSFNGCILFYKLECNNLINSIPLDVGFPHGTNGKEPACQRRCKRCRIAPWVGKIPWREAKQSIPVFLPGESHGQRSLVGYSP